MRRIIGGRLYDTDTARKVGSTWHTDGFRVGDFHYYEEALYAKRTGEYFLHGRGGAETPYAEPVGLTGLQGGEKIVPLGQEEARAWAESHLDADEYVAAFGVPDEGDVTALTLRLPTATYRAMKAEAARRGRPMRDLVVGWAHDAGL